jgi:glucose/arabinose dehydrogenase
MSGYRLASGYKVLLVISLALLLGLLPIFLFSKPAIAVGNLPSAEFTQERLVDDLTDPTAMAFAPDGRLFVTEQAGTMQVVNMDGTLQSTPFLDIPDNQISAVGERGLLGVAFDPDFDPTFDTTDNNYVYVYYTVTEGGIHNRVARFTATEDSDGNVVAGTEEFPIFELPPLSATNHNGGAIHFGQGAGEEDKLYVAVGENARPAEAQSLNSLLGKMLRINKDGTIPSDNPFIDYTQGQNQAIWALGLRNPYSFDVQPDTGRIFINDVGQRTWEEINDGIPGTNYGWPYFEGPVSGNVASAKKKKKHGHKKRRHKPRYYYYTGPLLYAYTHSSGCAITGGTFYNPPSQADSLFPDDYRGDYFFADFCGGWLVRYDVATNTATGFASGAGEYPVDLKVSEEGDLYFLARGTGSVERIHYTG